MKKTIKKSLAMVIAIVCFLTSINITERNVAASDTTVQNIETITFENDDDAAKMVLENSGTEADGYSTAIVSNPRKDGVNSSDKVISYTNSYNADYVYSVLKLSDESAGKNAIKTVRAKVYLVKGGGSPIIFYDCGTLGEWRGLMLQGNSTTMSCTPVRVGGGYKIDRGRWTEAPEIQSTVKETFALSGTDANNGIWVDVVITYHDTTVEVEFNTPDGLARLGGYHCEIATGTNVTQVAFGGYAKVQFYFDDISVTYTDAEVPADAIQFQENYDEVLRLRATTLSNIDKDELDEATVAYEALSDEAKAALPLADEKLQELNEAYESKYADNSVDLENAQKYWSNGASEYVVTDAFEDASSLGKYVDVYTGEVQSTVSQKTANSITYSAIDISQGRAYYGNTPRVEYSEKMGGNALWVDDTQLTLKADLLPENAVYTKVEYDFCIADLEYGQALYWEKLRINVLNDLYLQLKTDYTGYTGRGSLLYKKNHTTNSGFSACDLDPWEPMHMTIEVTDTNYTFTITQTYTDETTGEEVKVEVTQTNEIEAGDRMYSFGSQGVSLYYDDLSIMYSKGKVPAEPEPEVPGYDVEVDFSADSSSLYEDKTSETDILAIYSALGITPTETPVYSFDGALNINTYNSGNNDKTTPVTTGDYTFTADGGGYNGLTALIGLKENPGLIEKLQFTCTITAAAHQAPVLVTSYTNDAVFDGIAISAVPTLRYYTRAYSTDSNTVTITQGTDLVTYTDRECTVAATENLTAGEATVTMEFGVVDGNPYYLVEISDGTNSHYFRWEITELLDNFYLGTVRYNSKISSLKYNVFSGVGDADITNLTNQQFVKLRALSVLHSDLFTDDEKTVLEAATGYVVTYTADEFAAYRTGDAYTAPTPINQYLFAGWYCDTACKTAVGTATKAVETETVYAKFVPAAVLTVKAQISANLVDTSATNDEIGNIRFITTVDSLRYSQVGFKLSYDKGDGNPVKDRISASNKVYTELYAVGSTSGEDKTYEPTDFCEISQYFKACTVRNVLEDYYGMEFTVTSFWITLDGTTVDGETVVKTVDQAMVRNAVYVSSSGTNAAGYGTYSRPYETLTYALDKVAKTGTIYVKDTCSMTSDAWIEHGKTLTIASADEESLGTVDFSSLSELHINDAVTFDKINLGLATTVYANGNALEITKDVTLTNADGTVILYGGSEDKPVTETNLTLYAGSYAKIYGGGNGQDVDGDTNIIVGGNVNSDIDESVHGGGRNLFGGSNQGTVTGNTKIKVVKVDNVQAKFDYIYGGGNGSDSTVLNSCIIEFDGIAESILGGSLGGTCRDTYVTMTDGYVEQIFGGSDGCDISNSTNVSVLGGKVLRRVYGGCYNAYTQPKYVFLGSGTWTYTGSVLGHSNVRIEPKAEILFDFTDATYKIKVDNSLYAISRCGKPFDVERGAFIFNENSDYLSTLGYRDSYFKNDFSTLTYHYLVTTNGNTGNADSPGTVTADGGTLIIAPAPGYTATVTDGNGNTTTFDAEGTYTFPSVSTEEQVTIEVTFN